MKKLLVMIASIMLTIPSTWAQIFMIDSFSLASSDGGYGIYVDIDCEESTELYFDMDTDDPTQKTRMQLSSREVNTLKKNLESAMAVFDAWREIATKNSMCLLAKKMPLLMDTQEIFFTQEGQWHMAESVELNVTFFVDDEEQCFAILETGTIKSKEVVAKAFGIAASVSPNGRWNTSWARSEKSVIRYGDKAYLIFTNRNEVNMFIAHLDDAIKWKEHNRDMGELLVRPKKK